MSDTPELSPRGTRARVGLAAVGARLSWRKRRTGRAALLLLACCFALVGLRCEADARQDQIDQAIGYGLDAANAALAVNGTPLDPDQLSLAKSVVKCAVDGASLADCGRSIVAGQLPSDVQGMAKCLLQGTGELQKCAIQGALDLAQVPDAVKTPALCMLNSDFSAGAIRGCAQDALVKQIPDPSVQAVTGCLLAGQQTPQQCAVTALPADTPPDMRNALNCVVNGTPVQQCAAGALPAGFKEAAACLANPSAVQQCLQNQLASALPPGPAQDMARCMTDPARAQQCALDQVNKQLPGMADLTNCLAKDPNFAHCADRAAVSDPTIQKALDALKSLHADASDALTAVGSGPGSLGNIVRVAQGVRDNKWDDVLLYGGTELYKQVVKIAITAFLEDIGGPAGTALGDLAGPVVDAVVQHRLDLVACLLDSARRKDVPKGSQCVAEFYFVAQVEMPCALMTSLLPSDAAEATCGNLGKAIQAVGGLVHDLTDDAGHLIQDAADDVGLGNDVRALAGGDNCPSTADYYAKNVLVCAKEQAYLQLTRSPRAQAVADNLNSMCRHDFAGCTHHVVGDIHIGLGGISIAGGDSQRLDQKCNPLQDAFRKNATGLANGLQQVADGFARGNFKVPPKCASQDARDAAISDFVPDCVAALQGQFPGLSTGVGWSTCGQIDHSTPFSEQDQVFDAACRSIATAMATPRPDGHLFGNPPHGNSFLDQIVRGRASANQEMDQLEVQLECQQQTQMCRNYNNTAIQQAQEAIRDGCGGGGSRWDPNADHFGWCMSVTGDAAAAETQARADGLRVCAASFPPEQNAACQRYAWNAVQQARRRASLQTCAPASGPRWTDNYDDHFAFCRWGFRNDPAHIIQVMNAESAARNAEISACTPSPPAPPPRPPAQAGPVTGPSSGGGSGGVYYVMPNQSGPLFPASPPGTAVAPTPQAPVATAPAFPSAGGPAAVPTAPPACAGGMVRNSAGTCVCPTGTHFGGRTCVADRPAPLPRPSANVPCPDPGQHRDPQSGVCFSCSHNDHFENGRCVPNAGATGCLKGTHLENGVCVSDAAAPPARCPLGMTGIPPTCCPPGTLFKAGKCEKPVVAAPQVLPARCPLGMTGVPPTCCSPGTLFKDGKCEKPVVAAPQALPARCPLGMTGVPPTCCQPGTLFKDGRCEKPVVAAPQALPARCPLGMTGVPPTCCPPGLLFKDGKCEKPGAAATVQTCPPDRPVGTFPNCCPHGREFKNGACVSACPPGFKVLDHPNKFGAFCEEAAATSCPPGSSGTLPNCRPPPAPVQRPAPTGPAPHKTCNANEHEVLNPQTGQCVCGPGFDRTPQGCASHVN